MMEQVWNYKSVVAKDSNNTGGESNWRYFDMSKITDDITGRLLVYFAAIVKTNVSSFLSTGPIIMGALNQEKATDLIAVPTNIPMSYINGETATFKEACIKNGIKEEDLAVGEISKEEFYSVSDTQEPN